MSDMTRTPAEFDCFADYVRGQRAVLTRVGLRLSEGALAVHLPDGAVERWPWEDIRALQDQADREGAVLYRKGADLARLFVQDTEVAAQLRARAPNLARRSRPVPVRRLITWSAGAVASVAAIIFVLVPLMAAQGRCRWVRPYPLRP